MATKGDQIRNLVKAFGGEPRQSTIEDAIEDLVGLFEEKRTVKMVEIVPEQSVTIIGEMTEITNIIHKNYKTVTENSNLYLTVDGKEMKCNFAGIHHDMLGFMAENEKLAVVFYSSAEVIGLSNMTGEYDGKTVTVKVFTKQETVTPPVVSVPRVEKKLVEIMPEQSGKGYDAGEEWYGYDFEANLPVEDGKTYIINFNGEKLKSTCTLNGNGVSYSLIENDELEIDFYNEDGVWFTEACWSAELGETITLAIYEEQEIVKQLDPKFVGGSKTILYPLGDHLYLDETRENAVSIDELFDMCMSGNVLVYNNDFYCMPAYFGTNRGGNGDYAFIAYWDSSEMRLGCSKEYAELVE